ncbi:MAG: hypothetical protein Q8M16_05645, partial [Pirellulaceae bacterium]|nr:hypothetical protein [Pirellulaceae bacterium]
MVFRIAILIWMYMHVGALSFAVEQEQDKANEYEMLSTTIQIEDPDGHPLEGAVVELMWMSSKKPSNASFPWPTGLGEVPRRVTNDEGQVELPFPKIIVEKIAIDRLYVKVSHPDYVGRNEYIWIENGNPIRLEHGFRIAATAIHGVTGDRIFTNLHIGRAWKLAENGTLVSEVFPRQPTGVRLVTIEAGEARLFSDLIIVKPGDRSRVLLKDVKLFPGVTVNGILNESIPRPIKNGIVEARLSLEVFDSDKFGRVDSIWMAHTKIQEDGRFTFKSLPRGGIVQLLPICEHWSSKQLSIDEVKQFFPEAANSGHGLPQLFRMDTEIPTLVLQMEPSVIMKARVVDKNSLPVSNAKVVVSPNKSWFESDGERQGGGLLNEFSNSVEFILNPLELGSPRANTGAVSSYTAKTDHDGIAV